MKALSNKTFDHHQVRRFNCRSTGKVFSIVLLTSCLFLLETQSQKLTVIPVDEQYSLSLDGLDYQKKNLDIIWNISYSAEIKISTFDIDTLSGDFLVICQYPLPDDDRLSTGAAAESVIHLLPIENSLLLSPEVLAPKPPEDGNPQSNEMIIRISSPYGAFIYFHGVISEDETVTGDKENAYGRQQNIQHVFEGFRIKLNYFDLNPTTVVPSTTEKLTTPAPGVGIYIKKHVLGKTPGEFYKDLDTFKEAIADMGNAYCHDIYECNLPHPINATNDVRLTEEMIFFCERSLPYYSTCVQVKFAITIRNIFGTYVMTSDRLEEMWAKYTLMNLTGLGLQPYEPPTTDPPITTWIWAAAALGSILALSSILCFALVGNNIFQTNSSERNDEAIKTVNYEDMKAGGGSHSRGSTVSTFGDKDSPIWKVLQTKMIMESQLHDEESYGMHDLEREVAQKSREDMRPLNHLLPHAHQGHFNNAYDDEDEEIDWPPPASGFIESPVIHHKFAASIMHHSTDGDSDEAIELHNQF